MPPAGPMVRRMTQTHYDFCVAAGQPSGRDATGGGQQWAASALYTCRLVADGSAIDIVSSTELPSTPPGYMTLARTRSGEQMLYVTSGKEVRWFSIDDQNELTPLGSVPTGSESASHLCTDPDGRLLFTANYGSGSVSLIPIAEDGTLGEAKVYSHGPGAHAGAEGTWGDGPQFRQESAHPHGVVVCGEQLYVADLGTNQVVCWTIDLDNNALEAASAITVHDLAGPRHIQFTSDGELGFVLNELDNTVCVLRRDATKGVSFRRFRPCLRCRRAGQRPTPILQHSQTRSTPNRHTHPNCCCRRMTASCTPAIAGMIPSRFLRWIHRPRSSRQSSSNRRGDESPGSSA